MWIWFSHVSHTPDSVITRGSAGANRWNGRTSPVTSLTTGPQQRNNCRSGSAYWPSLTTLRPSWPGFGHVGRLMAGATGSAGHRAPPGVVAALLAAPATLSAGPLSYPNEIKEGGG